ncbi:MAG: hypothetical protein DYG87_12595 [Anaerolineae bacterium CFX3]|jgi:hypothetical protein|nr:hypothetical protein [Anaerolineae bacterium CFX3]MCQ3947720.1 hypothetical protein [Anaerolineae bacterium]MCZ2288557.1 hypothetical protein [Anaerolineales bacterium]RIK24924.1 MAG: hypothetical protein DCC54_12250 [Anaerolineae bacterium]
MNEFYRAKFNELLSEFSRYLITHPDFGENIPKGAEVILLDRNDPGYTNFILEHAPTKKQDHPVVFIDVGVLAPIRSRLRKPKIIARPPAVIAG